VAEGAGEFSRTFRNRRLLSDGEERNYILLSTAALTRNPRSRAPHVRRGCVSYFTTECDNEDFFSSPRFRVLARF
jgi:hypothetical protein